MNIFGYYDFYGFFFFFFLGGGGVGVTTKSDYIQGVIQGSVLKVNVQNGNMWWGIVKLQIFLGMHDNQHKLEPSLRKSKVPPPPPWEWTKRPGMIRWHAQATWYHCQ